MKRDPRILTTECCEHLLTFTSNPIIRANYDSASFDPSLLKYVNFKTKYLIDDEIVLGVQSKDDAENSKLLFYELKHLDRVQANDKRLWACLTHTIFFNYTRDRWSISSDTSNDTIISRFHFEGTGVEARMRNAVSRLWWSAKLTFDEKRDNPFELTELLWEKQDIITSLVERTFGTYQNVLHGFLELYKINKHLKESEIRTLAKGLNAVGGVKVLPAMTKQSVIEQLKHLSNFNGININ